MKYNQLINKCFIEKCIINFVVQHNTIRYLVFAPTILSKLKTYIMLNEKNKINRFKLYFVT